MTGQALSALGIVLASLAGLVGLMAGGGRASGWAVAMAALAAAASALAFFAEDALARRGIGSRPLALAVAALVAWAWLGLVPLPQGVLETLSPRRAAVQAAVPAGTDLAAWTAAASPAEKSLAEMLAEPAPGPADLDLATSGRPFGRAPASFAPWSTRTALTVLLGFALLLLALATRPSPRAGLAVVAATMAMAVVSAGAGLWLWREAPGKAWGVMEQAPGVGAAPYGAFFSLNHAAALFAMACPVLLGLFLDPGRRAIARLAGAVALAPVALALLDAGSRGGLLAGGAAAILLGLALLRTPGRRAFGIAIAGGAALATVLAFTLLADRLIDESFEQTVALQGSNLERATLYRTEAEMVAASPVLGTGVGAFRTAHGAFRAQPDPMLPLHGESDWLESAVEGGVPWTLLWGLVIALILAPPLAVAWRGQAPPLLSGLTAGAIATVLHAAVDFHLREPVVAVTAIALAATAHAWSRSLAGASAAPAPPRWRLALPAAAAVAVAALAMLATREVPRDRHQRAAERALEAGDLSAGIERARAAVSAAPSSGDGWALLAHAEDLAAAAERPGPARARRRKAAVEAAVRAIELSPVALGAARRCAAILLAAGAEAEATEAARLALAVSPGQGPTRRVAGQVLLRHGASDQALEHLAFAFNAVALPRMASEARPLAAWMLEAAGGDAPRALRLIDDPRRQVWFVSELARLRRPDEARACLAELARHPPSGAGADALVSLVFGVPGAESLALARALEPVARLPLSRLRLGVAMVREGSPAEGEALIREGLAGGADAPEAWLALAQAARARGDNAGIARAWREGLERHPSSSALKALATEVGRTP